MKENQETLLGSLKKEYDSLIKNKKATSYIKLILFLIIISWITLGACYEFLPPEVPLFFSKPTGNEQLVPKIFLTQLPLFSSLLFILNIRFASIAMENEKLLAWLFLASEMIFSLFSLIILVRIIFLIG